MSAKKSAEDLPEPDRLPGLPHPRETATLIGHEAAEDRVLAAMARRSLPQAWLISGPRGVGKASFAYRVTRALLAWESETPPSTLDLDPEHPVARQIAAGSHPNFMGLKRPLDQAGKKLKTQIPVDEVRRLSGFFGQHAATAGWRVCIVDSADELGPAGANALLKTLEEPPRRCVFLLISHAPGRLLPTIRSRCQQLALSPLSPEDMTRLIDLHAPSLSGQDRALAVALSGGAPGQALELTAAGGLALYGEILKTIERLPQIDAAKAHALGARLASAQGEGAYRIFVRLIRALLQRLARRAALGYGHFAPAEAALVDRVMARTQNPVLWLDILERFDKAVRETDAVNLDRRHLVHQSFSDMAAAVANRAA